MQIEFKSRSGGTVQARVTEQAGLFLAHLPGASPARAIPIVKPPENVDENQPAWAFVLGGVSAVLTLADTTEGVTSDGLLSGLGKTHALEPARKHAVGLVRAMAENAARAQAAQTAALAQLFEFPAVSSSPVELATDREIRDRFHASNDDDKTRTLMEILADPVGRERVALALARSPYPLGRDKADQALRDAREKSVRSLRPISCAAADLGVAAAGWAVTVLQSVAEACASVASLPRDTLFDLIDGQDAAPVHVLTAFGFRNPSEIVMLRARRAAAA